MQLFSLGEGHFSRDRKLNLVNTVGSILYLVSHRNSNGYAITSQNYFSDLRNLTGLKVSAASRSSVCEARQKISYELFGYLLNKLNEESDRVLKEGKWKGHRVRAVDGSRITLPHTKEILENYPRSENQQNKTHYPYSLLVTASDVFTGIPKCARMADQHGSEREQFLSILDEFEPGDISLLDRGFDGVRIWQRLEELGQNYVCRIKTGGNRTQVLKNFLASGKTTGIVDWETTHKDQTITAKIRLIRVRGADRKGFPIVIGTNLLDWKKYPSQSLWELYKKRWRIETLYGRIKELFCLENFHARSINGVYQEILASLFMLGMTAYLSLHAAKQKRINLRTHEPNFKNALEVLRRHLIYGILQIKLRRDIMEQILEQIGRIVCEKQPGRKNPRVCKRPTHRWNKQKGKNRPKNKWDRNLMKIA